MQLCFQEQTLSKTKRPAHHAGLLLNTQLCSRQPRPAKGILVAMTVWNITLASSGKLAI